MTTAAFKALRPGTIVRCLLSHTHSFTKNRLYAVSSTDANWVVVTKDDKGSRDSNGLHYSNFEIAHLVCLYLNYL